MASATAVATGDDATRKGGTGGAPACGGTAPPPPTTQTQTQQQPPPPLFNSSQYFSLPAMNSGDLPPAIRRYCKAEQQVVSSGQTASVVSPSRETGLSTDPNAAGGYAEISSAVTPSSSSHQFLPELDDPVLNLADLWKY